jgi:hypothetical protein
MGDWKIEQAGRVSIERVGGNGWITVKNILD